MVRRGTALAALVALSLCAPVGAQTASPAAGEVTEPAPKAPSGPAPLVAPAPEAATALPVAEAAPPARAPVTAPTTAPVTPPALAPDYTIRGMIVAAHWVVQAVMALLAAAVFATLTVLLYKSVELTLALRGLRLSTAVLGAQASLAGSDARLSGRHDPAAAMARLSAQELALSAPALAVAGPAGVTARVRLGLERIEAQATARLRFGLGLLASIGATAPFIGLFGTVWGIMTSFLSIAQARTTTLAVVAPGIAEALLATAIGLAAAIPAVIIYNLLGRRLAAYRLALADAAAVVERLVSRDLDFARAPGG